MQESNEQQTEQDFTAQSEDKTNNLNTTESLEKSLKECQEKYLRLLADSENARKRMQKERQEHLKYAVENIIVEFLHPLDSFEKALKFAENMSDEVKNWALGFEMILGQFKQVLTANGIVPFESLGKHFDPHLHEAVEVIETEEYSSGTVVHEFLKGYRMGDRTIRPARVKVAKAPHTPLQDLSEEQETKKDES